jgi:uncharacterized membrane protein
MSESIRERISTARVAPLGLGLLVVVGSALRLERLGATPLNFDESFTAMAGRLPVKSLFDFLRGHDSHPPLDYLLQMPFARAGSSPFVFRLPAALCSIAALALFAWWMRDRGRAGIAATAGMAICAFQLVHAREARMYAPMQLIGVGVAVLAEAWLRAPRRRHEVIVGALTFVGLMTHVSMFLVAIGLLTLAGARRDVHAWRWRAAIATGVAGWALLWGPSFLVQARGGHSSWIAHTTPIRFIETVSALVTFNTGASVLVFAAIVGGVVACRSRDRVLASVLMCCCVVPVVLAGLLGLHAPVLLDRTLTVVAWGPMLALGYLFEVFVERARVLGVVAAAIVTITMLSSVPRALYSPGPTPALVALERVARPGDVVAIQPATKGVELYWTLGARSDDGTTHAINVPGLNDAVALALESRRPSGRVWVLQFTPQKLHLRAHAPCAHTWHHGPNRLLCVRYKFPSRFPKAVPATITALAARAAPK